MDIPSYLEPQLNVEISRVDEESVVRPKFVFAHGDEQFGDFTMTERFLHIMRRCLEEEACQCLNEFSQDREVLWDTLRRISLSCFRLLVPPSPPTILSTNQIAESDIPLWFDVLGLTLLDLNVDDSFLHINSGTGYACTIAALMLCPNGANHGVEFREERRELAKLNVERLVRFQTGMEAAYSLPFYHARIPADLLHGRSKFDRILITDCFEDLRDVLPLKHLLNPEGLLVTSFRRAVEDETEVGMVVVNRSELTDEDIRIEEIDEYEYSGQSYDLHVLDEKKFENCFLRIRDSRLDTIARLKEAQRSVESAVPSLHILSLRACSKLSDPVGRLRGDSRSPFFLRISSRDECLPNLSTQLGHLVAAFQSFRDQCTLTSEYCTCPVQLRSLEEELASLVVAFDELGKKFIGRQCYNSWKTGHWLQLPVLQGVMVWLLENTFHVFRYSEVNRKCYSITADSISESCLPHFSFLTDEISTAIVTRLVLKAFLSFFRTVDFQLLDQQGPFNYQLSNVQQMRRLLTRLAARFWADASYMLAILRTMKAWCDAVYGGPSWLNSVINSDLTGAQSFLTQLCDQVLTQSESFTSMERLLDTFSDLTAHIRRIHHDARFLLTAGWGIPEVGSLFCCFRFLCSSSLRNLMGSGRAQGGRNPVMQLHFENGEGSLVDTALFQKELGFFLSGCSQDFIHSEDVSKFLVRRFMSDLKESLWMAESVAKEKQLVMLEKNMRMYHIEVLKPHFSIPYIEHVLQKL